MYRLISLFAAAVLVTGCATGPRPYDESQSKAFNIARAGGLVTGIQDVEVDEEAYAALTERSTYQMADAVATGLNPGMGLSSMQGVGLSLLQSAVAPKSQGARHSMIAWMPIEKAGSEREAQRLMVDTMESSWEEVFSDMDLEYERLNKGDDWVGFIFYSDQWGCGEWVTDVSTLDDVCTLRVNLRRPHRSFAESYINGVDGESYFFDSSHGFKYNKVTIRAPSARGLPEDVLFASLSRHLPKWTYLYIPADHVQTEAGETNPLPYFLEGGKPLYFIYPQ